MFSTQIKEQIERDFNLAKHRLEGRASQLFSVFDEADLNEIICLKYIYAYLPLSDAASYDGSLFLKLTRDSLRARQRYPWVKKMPEHIFLNYVLAVRVNNEDLTDHRTILADALDDRIQGLSLVDAILEVNLFCYEKASYQSTDSRTVSPLTIMRRGFGRCGEESTFTVSALRSVGIAARQCYTPRWAHTDDNHAWVEVWIDGQWFYLGACEPEAVLNRAWFSAPAKRGMLVETRVFSAILEYEDVVRRGSGMTLINVSDHYFDTVLLTLVVSDQGQAVNRAQVDLCVINYAEFSPLVRLMTDERGRASLKIGRGDLWIRVTKGGRYVERFISLFEGDLVVEIDLVDGRDSDELLNDSFDLMMNAPIAISGEDVFVTETAEAEMAERITVAEQVRMDYLSTFYPAVDPDDPNRDSLAWRRAKMLADALGNYNEILSFLDETVSGIGIEMKLDLLEALNYKDLSDIRADILMDHLRGAAVYAGDYPADIFKYYLLNPRIGMEMISAWRKLVDHFDAEQIGQFRSSPSLIDAYVNRQYIDTGDFDYGTIMADPMGVLELGYASALSRRIFTIALTRSIGIPARINQQDYQLEFYRDDAWQYFRSDHGLDAEKARQSALVIQKRKLEEVILYGTHFTLAKLSKYGNFETLAYYSEYFDEAGELYFALEPGTYQLILCRRMPDGSQAAQVWRFSLAAHDTRQISIQLPDVEMEHISAAYVEAIELEDGRYETGSGIGLLALLGPGAEPTEHFIAEMISAEPHMRAYESQITLVVRDHLALEHERIQQLRAVFPHIRLAKVADDFDWDVYLERAYVAFDLHNRQLPLLLLSDEAGQVKLARSGYQVGSVAMILEHFN